MDNLYLFIWKKNVDLSVYHVTEENGLLGDLDAIPEFSDNFIDKARSDFKQIRRLKRQRRNTNSQRVEDAYVYEVQRV